MVGGSGVLKGLDVVVGGAGVVVVVVSSVVVVLFFLFLFRRFLFLRDFVGAPATIKLKVNINAIFYYFLT